jgi:hypothetical protein
MTPGPLVEIVVRFDDHTPWKTPRAEIVSLESVTGNDAL